MQQLGSRLDTEAAERLKLEQRREEVKAEHAAAGARSRGGGACSTGGSTRGGGGHTPSKLNARGRKRSRSELQS